MTGLDGIVVVLQERLVALDEERAEITRLLRRYAASPASPQSPRSAPIAAAVPHAAAPLAPVRSSAEPGGPTQLILSTVAQEPGITATAMINRIVPQLRGTSKKPRRSVAQTALALVKRGKIQRREGRYYPV